MQGSTKGKSRKSSTQVNTNKSNNFMCWECGLQCRFIEVGFSMLDFGKAVILYMLLQCSKKTPTSLAEYIG